MAETLTHGNDVVMAIQELGGGAFLGLALGIFICSPLWSFNVFLGKVKDVEVMAAIWGFICFVAFCGMWWSALFEDSTFSLSAAISCTVIWWWKSSKIRE